MTATATAEPVHRVREIADHLGVDDDTIYALIRDGKLRAIRLGRVLRVPASSLSDFIAGVEPRES